MTQALRLALLALLASWASLASALDPAKSILQYSQEVWSTEEGLPHNAALSLVQTRDGYVWFGTWEGLARFNGRSFRVFDRRTTPDLRDDGIRALCEGRDGSLWVGTYRGGLSRLKDGRWTTYGKKDGLASDSVVALSEDAQGHLWVGTQGNGLSRFDGRAFVTFTKQQGLPDDAILSLCPGRDGSLWVGTARGLSRLRAGGVESLSGTPGLSGHPVLSIFEDRAGIVWVGTDQGLSRVAGAQSRLYTAADGLSDVSVSAILEDRRGNLWVGTGSGGLNRLRDGRFESLTTGEGLSNNRVTGLVEDREGILWIGTNGGVTTLRDGPVTTYTTRKGLSDDFVRAVYEDAQGSLWFGTSHGLSRFRDGRFETFTAAQGLTNDSILSLWGGRDGTLWVGTYGGGLNTLRDGRFSAKGTKDGLASNQVRALLEASDGSLWIGTAGGLNRLLNGRLETFGTREGLPSAYVLSLHEDREGTLWVGTADGLALRRDGSFVGHTRDTGFPAQAVFAFHEDSQGALWLGTSDGLVRHERGRFQVFTTRQGLFSDTIFQVLEDDEGQLWMSCNRGLFRTARAELEQLAAGQRSAVTSLVYGQPDGMASSQCNGASQPAGWRSRDGRLWFPTARGVAMVDPRRSLQSVPQPPPLAIEEVLIDGEAVDPSGTISVPPGKRTFEFRYAGLSFLAPGRVQYRYRLEGFDPDWVVAGGTRSVRYTNLPPGRYGFHVTARLGQGQWNPNAASVSVDLAPRFYQRPLFLGLGVAALVLGAWRAFLFRVRQLEEREQLLQRTVGERTRALQLETQKLAEADEEKSALLRKLTEQSDAFERLSKEDALTGLANRRRFDEVLAQEFARARRYQQPLTVAMADIDFFKAVNDRFSHKAGDEVLVVVARLIRESCRGTDLAARYGGEEFGILFPQTTAAGAAVVCERIRSLVASADLSAICPGQSVTISIGVSDWSEAPHPDKLITAADEQLYAAKHAGRNCVRRGDR